MSKYTVYEYEEDLTPGSKSRFYAETPEPSGGVAIGYGGTEEDAIVSAQKMLVLATRLHDDAQRRLRLQQNPVSVKEVER